MGDFLTRLAERTLGVAPVVQPMIASVFAPETTSYSPALEWDGEATTSSGALDRVQAPPAWDAPKEVPEDSATPEHEQQGPSTRIAPPHPPGTSDNSPEPHHPAKSGPSARRTTSGQEGEDQGTANLGAPNVPRRTPDAAGADSFEGQVVPGREEQRASSRVTTRHPRTLPETLRHAEPKSMQRGALPTSQRVLPDNSPFGPPAAEDGAERIMPRLIGTSVGQGQGATLLPRPSPDKQATPDAAEGTMQSNATPDRRAPSDAPPVAPRTLLRPRLDAHLERGPQEPRVAATELSASNIRVAIGRIEVRATTPPPPPVLPARRTAPARPGPALSLDDYLKQRNGGQR